jgi:hypothetical protein
MEAAIHPSPQVLEQWQRILDWKYPFLPATHRAAKGSVTASDVSFPRKADSAVLAGTPFDFGESQRPSKEALLRPDTDRRPRKKASAAEIGTANHIFLQLCILGERGELR